MWTPSPKRTVAQYIPSAASSSRIPAGLSPVTSVIVPAIKAKTPQGASSMMGSTRRMMTRFKPSKKPSRGRAFSLAHLNQPHAQQDREEHDL